MKWQIDETTVQKFLHLIGSGRLSRHLYMVNFDLGVLTFCADRSLALAVRKLFTGNFLISKISGQIF